ncbi:hypothetical protein MKW98_002035 [Papaver atlanticum]|uniref:Uncharacterized protein n=1 Tax=Papaver atlanticum TaxID=357466 RepID=A0AAD4RUD3_9MAGN|nr:hypothetical protein MKW98_002035 [Papaver atlanticum]
MALTIGKIDTETQGCRDIAIISSFGNGRRQWWKLSLWDDNFLIKKIMEFDEVNKSGFSTVFLKDGYLYCSGGMRNQRLCNEIVKYHVKGLDGWAKASQKLQSDRCEHVSLGIDSFSKICVLGGCSIDCGEYINSNLSSGRVIDKGDVSIGKIRSFAFYSLKNAVFIWGEGSNQQFNVHKHKQWEPLPDLLRSLTPICFQCLIFPGSLLLTVELNVNSGTPSIKSYKFISPRWEAKSSCLLRTKPKEKKKVYMVKAGIESIALIYQCEQDKVNCYLYKVDAKTGSCTLTDTPSVAFDILPSSALLSTVTSLWTSDQKEKGDTVPKYVMEAELSPEDCIENSYYMKLREDPESSATVITLFEPNTHKHIKEGGLLTCFIPSDGLHPCVHQGYKLSLRDLITSLREDVFWISYYADTHHLLHDMGPLLLSIVKQVLIQLIRCRRKGGKIKEVNLDNIVFLGSAEDPGIPLLIDCQTCWSDDDTGFNSLANLILECRTYAAETRGVLSPCLHSFCRCLRNDTIEGSWIHEKMVADNEEWDHLLCHPVFCDRQQKYEYLRRIRDNLKGQYEEGMTVPIEELAPYDFGGNWLILLQNSTYEFVQDKVADIKINFLGQMIEKMAPGLLPAHFERHGSLQLPEAIL